MENFFNYISKPVDPEDVDLWFRVNNIFPEKLNLFYDFVLSLNYLIIDTYLGHDEDLGKETKITMTEEDIKKHFKWCWDKTIENFGKENLIFEKEGEHYEYFESFYLEVFYRQKDKKVRESIYKFFNELFSTKKPYTKSDLDMILTIYKSMEKTLVNKKNV